MGEALSILHGGALPTNLELLSFDSSNGTALSEQNKTIAKNPFVLYCNWTNNHSNIARKLIENFADDFYVQNLYAVIFADEECRNNNPGLASFWVEIQKPDSMTEIDQLKAYVKSWKGN